MSDRALLWALATSFLAGEGTVEGIVGRGSKTLGRRWRWLRPLAQRYLASFSGRTRPRHRHVIHFLRNDRGFRSVRSRYRHELSVEDWLYEPQVMQPVAAAESWDLPEIESPRALAQWLGLSASELRWFADLKALATKTDRPRLQHYNYRVLAKQSGHVRLIEAPKTKLKQLQRRILEEILEKVPAHPATHGFVKGRSIKTFVSPHVGRRIILKMDLCDFFFRFLGREFKVSFAHWAIPSQLQICWVAFAQMPLLVLHGKQRPATPTLTCCEQPGGSTLVLTCPRVRPHLPGLRTCALTASIAAWRVWRDPLAQSTRAMPTISHSPAMTPALNGESNSLQPTWRPCLWKRASQCTIERRG